MSGPLEGTRVLELAGAGPVPFAGMLLSDLGAEVIRIDRPGPGLPLADRYSLARGRRSVAIDLKSECGRELALDLVDRSDLMIEGYRPGVAERLGLGPKTCLERRPALVYGRVTGWGQDGPLAGTASHDLNVLALSGALTLFQRDGGAPAIPPGFIADFGGGGAALVVGVLAALLHSRLTGEGQVVDASMLDGVATLSTLIWSMIAQDRWHGAPDPDGRDGEAPYYDVYETRDGGFMAVAALEPAFYSQLLTLLEIDEADIPDRLDRGNWTALRELFASVFATRTRIEWQALFEGTDACVSPVLSFSEAAEHPHARYRQTHITEFDVLQPAPSPRFSRTPADVSGPPVFPGEDSRAVLGEWGIDSGRVERLIRAQVVGVRPPGPDQRREK